METVDAVQTNALQNIEILPILVGVVTSAVVGFFAILLFKWMLAKDRMYIFVIYTAVVGAAVIVVSLIEMHSGTNLFTGAALTYG